MARLGLNDSSEIGCIINESGFELFERGDGIHPTPILQKTGGKRRYNDYLKGHGYQGQNPWNDYANLALSPNGEILSRWELRNSHLPARVKDHIQKPPT